MFFFSPKGVQAGKIFTKVRIVREHGLIVVVIDKSNQLFGEDLCGRLSDQCVILHISIFVEHARQILPPAIVPDASYVLQAFEILISNIDFILNTEIIFY